MKKFPKQKGNLNMCSLNERIENLKRDLSHLRKEIQDIKETLTQQNELVMSLLSIQSGLPVQKDETEKIEPEVNIEIQEKASQLSRYFPLKSFEDLNEFESEINEDNKTHFVYIIKTLLSPEGIYRNLANVFSYNIIMESNVNGRHYKTNLANFRKTMDVLFMASHKDENYTFKNFLDILKRSLRLAQNRRHTKNRSDRRRLLREEPTQEPHQTVKPNLIVRTQETYFPPLS